MMKRLALSMLMCLTLLSFGTQARAESEMYKFCKHDINTSEEIKAMIGSITMGTILIKGVLATAANVIIINRVNKETLKIVGDTAELGDKIFPVFAPSTRAFFKAFIPTIKAAEGQLSRSDGYFKKLFIGRLNQDGLTAGNSAYASHPVVTFYKHSLKFFKYWDFVAGSIIAYQVAAKITCAEVKKAHQQCMNKAKNKSKCDISFNDLPETDADMSVERSSCSANDAAEKYTALMTRLAPTVRKMRTANKKILKALKPLKAMVSKASAALSPLRGTLNGVDKAMKVLKKGLSPFKVFSTAVKKAMNKKVCIKFKIKIGKIKKQSKKCSRPKNLVKTIKKYTQAAQKAFKVATQKIIDPIINKVKRKVMKIPGLSKMKSSLSKLASKMNINKKLNSASKVLASVPGKTFVTQLQSATTQIKSLNTQMSR